MARGGRNMSVRQRSIPDSVLQGGFGILLLILWFAAVPFIAALPTPMKVLGALQSQIVSGALIQALSNALYAIIVGYLLAIVTGIPLGVIMGINRRTEEFFDPYVNALYVTPFSAMVPAMILWFGTGTTVRVVMVLLFAIFPMIINTLEGAKTTPPELIEVSQSFGASRRFLIWKVILPYEIPYIAAALRLGAGRAIKGLVVAEILISVTGFGGILYRWSAAYKLEGVISVVIILMAMGVVSTWALRQIEDRLIGWDANI